MHWLIAEDEADIRNLVVMMTQVWGHTPLPFDTGQKAWEWLDQVERGTYSGAMPDFALMDIRMPGKRGYELSQRMRTLEPLKEIPIVLMTAFVMSEDEMAEMRRKYGVDHVINKPLPDFDRLKQTIDQIIAGKQTAKADGKPADQQAPKPIDSQNGKPVDKPADKQNGKPDDKPADKQNG